MRLTPVIYSICLLALLLGCRRTPQASHSPQSATLNQFVAEEDSSDLVAMRLNQSLFDHDTTLLHQYPHWSATVQADLDCNGSPDTIRAYIFALSQDRKIPSFDHFVLVVGSRRFFGEAQNLASEIAVVDINARDRVREIAVSDYGYSDHNYTRYFVVDPDSIREIGSVPGITITHSTRYEDYHSDVVKYPGDGTISTLARGNVLHTWQYPAVYQLNAHHQLKLIPQAYRTMNTDVMLKISLSLKTSPSDTSNSFMVEKGNRAVIELTDDVRWCRIRVDDGKVGWFAVSPGGEVLGTGLLGGYVFDGLQFAD
jgi:hypothetical protein